MTRCPSEGRGTPNIEELFERARQRMGSPDEIRGAWRQCLTRQPAEEAAEHPVFASYTLDGAPCRHEAGFCGLAHMGESLLASAPRASLLSSIADPELHFRVIFLTDDAPVRPGDIGDPRVAVCLPGDLTAEGLDAAAELRAWETVRSEVAAQVDAGAPQLAEAERRCREAGDHLCRVQRDVYAAGTVVTRGELAISAADVFAIADPDARCAAIAVPVLRHAYHALPELLPPTAFPPGFVLSPPDPERIFASFASGESPGPRERQVLGRIAPCLLLPSGERLQEVPADKCHVCRFIRHRLERGRIELRELYHELQSVPYGLPPVVLTLHLLLLAHCRRPPTRILLRAGHAVPLASGEEARDCLTASTSLAVVWSDRLDEHFEALVVSDEIVWDDVLPYARGIVPGLGDAKTQEAVRKQEDRLTAGLRALRADVESVRQTVRNVLQPALGGRLSRDDRKALATAHELSAAQSGAELVRLARDKGVAAEDVSAAAATVERLKKCAEWAEMLAAARTYIDAALIPPHYRDLAATKALLATQLALTNVARNPNLIPGLRRQFADFKATYSQLYADWHRGLNEAKQQLRRRLEALTVEIEALRRLNDIRELGAPSEVDAYGRQQALLRATELCLAEEPIPPADAPVCRMCGMRLGEEAAVAAVDVLERAVKRGCEQRTRALTRILTSKILARARTGDLQALHEALQLSHLRDVSAILTDELVAYIRELLQE